MIAEVKEADPNRWYSILKRISNYDKDKHDELKFEEINHLTDKEQAEAIAENINKISQEYSEIKAEDIDIPNILPETVPQFPPPSNQILP